MEKPKFWHIPVLLNELVDSIEIAWNRQNIVVDCTLGLGGHASKIIGKLNKWDIFVGFDADEDNLNNASLNIDKNIWEYIKEKNIKIYFINSNFRNLKFELNKIWIDKVTWIYYDLWVSSVHFDDENKWFSFRGEGTLDMRFDRKSWLTAKDIVNNYSENDLYRVFREYWEEKKSKFIIDNILKARIEKEIKTTKDLLEIIEGSSFDPKSKLRVFQALRIEVNDEFGALKESLQDAVKLLDVGWIISVISFHSLEDRIVKQTFNEFIKTEINQITGMNMTQPILEKVYKKPLIPKQNELDSNPRSRSSKLRVLKKINNII
ncbi:MAG: S-adenosyl-methyltransferase MraW [uncultured bacterium (gcode 4)]|uniref:Ribosomal RNA small subunit methyltransferase H n=1 Tax=uncultured bacterium (gcode 4) TaxID=1234023 RepID=K2AVV6_9BACT|nr:MAG: S-adenosyl-methyltransferase MraW [uncultured bacterium (gcode 4)]